MKRKHFLLVWILAILLACAACTDTGDTTNSGNNQNLGTSSTQSSVSNNNTDNSENSATDESTSSGLVTDTAGENNASNTHTDSSVGSTDTESTTTQGSSDKVTSNTNPSTDSDTKPSTSTTPSKPNTGTTTNTTTSSKPSVNTSTSKPSTGAGSSDNTTDSGTSGKKEPLHPIAPADYYGRTWLKSQPDGTNLVAAYDSIVKAAEAMSGPITFDKPIAKDQLQTVFHCYINDYPEHFWVDHTYTYSHNGTQAKGISLEYTMSATQKASAQKEFNKAVDKLLEGLDGSMNQFDMEKILHDRLVLAITYKDGSHAHDAYGAIVEHTAVCDGYARAFQLLCRKAGIRAIIAEGESSDPVSGKNVGHAWNVVQVNGKFYHVDVTWDDAGEPDDEHGIHYAWFNVTSKQLTEDHILSDSGYDVPDCDSDKDNYFIKTGKWLKDLTVDGVLDLLEDHGGEYHAHIYVKNPGNVKDFFQKNLFSIVSELGFYS